MASVEDFEAAAERVQGLSQAPSNDQLLSLYGLFKQATQGDATGKRPGMFDLRGRAKWDAWNARKGTSAEDARAAYVALVDSLT